MRAATPTRRLRAGPALVAYSLAVLAASPVRLWKKWKKLQRPGHEHEADPRRWTCRVHAGSDVDRAPPPRRDVMPAGPRVAFVGTGFGEMRLIERLTDALKAARPDVVAIWCFKTREPAEAAAASRPAQPLVALPFDFAVPVHNWLRNVAPDVVVFVEQFDYPALARGAAAAGARVCLANGMTWSKTSRAPHRRLPQRAFRRWLSGAFSFMGFQSVEHWERAKPFLSPAVDASVLGNMKFDVEPPRNPAAVAAVAAWLASRSDAALLVAGSTRVGDDEFVLDAFARLREKAPATRCALLIAPRQIERAFHIATNAAARGFRVSRRSAASPSAPSTADVYVLDTIGELAAAYAQASAAFVGGTLQHLGHNVLEPLVFGVPVSFGPAPGHWAAEQRALEEAGVGFRVHTPDDLAAFWARALSGPSIRDDVRARANALFARQRGATARTVAAIARLLPPPTA